jgi:regulator of PEP synthase PpsR (kinase-PPPase family)
MPASRTIFFISASTAITAETLGQSLLVHFEHIDFDQVTIPFIDTLEKANEAMAQINADARMKALPPIVFSTIVNPEIRHVIMKSEGVVFDPFDAFMSRLEDELHMRSSSETGRLHGLLEDNMYNIRIDAVNYALSNDDGISTKDYDRADVIIVGVSRTGKTPTCLYLGLQFGIYAANYPLTEEDLYIEYKKIPGVLQPHRERLFGLTINPERLQKIRSERMPDSRYSSLVQCQRELAMAEYLFVSKNIPFINITTMSVEEIVATVMHRSKLQRRLF